MKKNNGHKSADYQKSFLYIISEGQNQVGKRQRDLRISYLINQNERINKKIKFKLFYENFI
jgi:hypothetical protein